MVAKACTFNTFWFLCISLLFIGDTLSQAVDFVPLLIQTVEKAAAQSSQHALLAEAVAASVLLFDLAMLDAVPGKPVWGFKL